MKFKATFEFPSPEARSEFLVWLCESGEQDYWMWCEVDPEERPAVTFDYHTENGGEFAGSSDKKETVVHTKKYDMRE